MRPGSIVAVEAIELILGVGDSLSGRLLADDSLEQSFGTYRKLRDPQCPACSIDPADSVIAGVRRALRAASGRAASRLTSGSRAEPTVGPRDG